MQNNDYLEHEAGEHDHHNAGHDVAMVLDDELLRQDGRGGFLSAGTSETAELRFLTHFAANYWSNLQRTPNSCTDRLIKKKLTKKSENNEEQSRRPTDAGVRSITIVRLRHGQHGMQVANSIQTPTRFEFVSHHDLCSLITVVPDSNR
jgi:hypothetical protein